MKKIIFLILCTISLSACSPEKIFELIAKSDIEQAASDSVSQSGEVITNFETIIDSKKQQYPHFTKLESTEGDSSYGYAFVGNIQADQKFPLEVHAVLPPLAQESHFYEAWLKEVGSGKLMSIGRMALNEDSNSRSLNSKSDKELAAYEKIIITEQQNQDKTPGKHVLENPVVH